MENDDGELNTIEAVRGRKRAHEMQVASLMMWRASESANRRKA